MFVISRPLILLLGCAAITGCTFGPTASAPYNSKAWRPQNPNNVKISVSLRNKMAYVTEGRRVLLVTPVTIGTAEDPTPKGDFKIFRKLEKKRSYTYGFHILGNTIRPGKSANTPSGGRYAGYPMPYWLEFAPGYGFHSGGVWPVPRSHGCLRVHKNVAPKLFFMIKSGTPVHIADWLPEDQTIGRNIPRPTDYAEPDPPASVLITPQAFPAPPAALYEAEPAPAI